MFSSASAASVGRASLLFLAFAFAALLSGPAAHAQQADSLGREAVAFSAELHAGAATYNRFLEQHVGARDRELTAPTGLSLGAALGLRLFDRNVVRLSLDYLPGQFEYRDDTGDGGDALQQSTDAEFNLFALSLEAERTFFEIGPVLPYASVGLSGSFWNLSQSGSGITSGSGILFRWGTTSGIGTRVRLSDHFFINLEANSLSLGNPFDGSDAFRVTEGDGTTFEEPRNVRVLRFRGGLRYVC